MTHGGIVSLTVAARHARSRDGLAGGLVDLLAGGGPSLCGSWLMDEKFYLGSKADRPLLRPSRSVGPSASRAALPAQLVSHVMRRRSCTGARAEQLRRQRSNSVGNCANVGSFANLCGSSSGDAAVSTQPQPLTTQPPSLTTQPPSPTAQESRTLAPWTTSGPPLCLEGTTALPPHDTATERIEQYRRRSGIGMKGELHLTGLALDSLPQPLYGLRHLTNLKELYLGHNKLGAIPDELAQLASLEKLDLTSNLLAEFPPELTQLTQLIALHLSRNRLTRLPEAVRSLKALQWLDLRRNALTELPMAAIQQMTSLTTLWCAPRPIEPRAQGLSEAAPSARFSRLQTCHAARLVIPRPV